LETKEKLIEAEYERDEHKIAFNDYEEKSLLLGHEHIENEVRL